MWAGVSLFTHVGCVSIWHEEIRSELRIAIDRGWKCTQTGVQAYILRTERTNFWGRTFPKKVWRTNDVIDKQVRT